MSDWDITSDMREAVARALCDRAKTDPSLMLITGDAGFGVLDEFRDTYPSQFLNAGIAEQSMTGMAAGMAIMGRKVVVYNIINFLLYRPFEQIRNDIVLQGLPVVLIGTGRDSHYKTAGMSHQAPEDEAVAELLGLRTLTPTGPQHAEFCVGIALDHDRPTYVRII